MSRVSLICLALATLAIETPCSGADLRLNAENDTFTHRTDDQYTQGARLLVDSHSAPRWIALVAHDFWPQNSLVGVAWDFEDLFAASRGTSLQPHGLDAFSLIEFDDTLAVNGTYGIGQLMYTPSDIAADTLISDDHPYAGYLFASIEATSETPVHFASFELRMGATGRASKAAEVQIGWHHSACDCQHPNGWQYQLPQKVGMEAIYTTGSRFTLLYLLRLLRADLSGRAQLAVGNLQDFGAVGSTLRAGIIQRADWGDRKIAATDEDAMLSPLRGMGKRRSDLADLLSPLEAYVSLRAERRYSFYDWFIGMDDGRFNLPIERGVTDAESGVFVGLPWLDVSYRRVMRSPQFKGPRARTHYYGVAAVRLNFDWLYRLRHGGA